MLEHGPTGLMFAVLAPAALVACWSDYRCHRIPNWLCAGVAAGGLTAQAACAGWSGLAEGLTGLAAGMGCLIVLWMMKAMGAGDVKLMAAVGTWLGPKMVGYAVLAGILTGGVMALAMIVRRRSWAISAANLGAAAARVFGYRTADARSAPRLADGATAMPYAIPLMAGTWLVMVCEISGWVKLS